MSKIPKWAGSWTRWPHSTPPTFLGVQATDPSGLLLTEYHEFHYCDMHHDQYERDGAPATLNRTVSVSLVVRRAFVGGDMLFQRPDKEGEIIEQRLIEGDVVLFPADWYHEVIPVNRGMRRSIVRWYADPTLEQFSSVDL